MALKIISKNNLNINKLNSYFFFVNFHFLVSHDPAIFYTIKRNRIHIFSNAFHGDFEKIPGLKGMDGKSLASGQGGLGGVLFSGPKKAESVAEAVAWEIDKYAFSDQVCVTDGGIKTLLVESAPPAAAVLEMKAYGGPSNGVAKFSPQLLAAKHQGGGECFVR